MRLPTGVRRAGDIDTSFGSSGRVTTLLPEELVTLDAVAHQPDGKLLTLGSFVGADDGHAVIRYERDGSLDSSFGARGRAYDRYHRGINDLVLDAGGTFVTAGGVGGSFELSRYGPDGSLDPSFGSGGRLTTSFPQGQARARHLARMDDGRLVALGTVNTPPDPAIGDCTRCNGPYSLALARYNADGSLDPSFGDSGRFTSSLGPGAALSIDQALQPDGKVIVSALYTDRAGFREDAVLLRFNPDGSRDASFADRGRLRLGEVGATNFALQPDGKLLVAGYRGMVARLRPDGSLDAGFGRGGAVRERPRRTFGVSDIALEPGGGIVLGGNVVAARGTFDTLHFGVARLTASGALDRRFGHGGLASTAFGGKRTNQFLREILVQPDGRLIAAGTVDFRSRFRAGFAFARFHTERFGSAGPTGRRHRLAEVSGAGLRVPVRCTQACRTRVEIVLDSSAARRFELPRVIGRTDTALSEAGSSQATVRLSARARSRLRRARATKAKLRVRFQARGRTAEQVVRRLVLSR